MRMLSAADSTAPARVPTWPAGAGRTCWANAASTVGSRFKTVIDHCAGAVGCLLSRLKECDQGAAPMIGAISEELGRPEQRGDVHVVSAGMHDRYLVAIGVGGLHRAGVIESGGLFDR